MKAERILVATDFSETADMALVEAHERAGQTGTLLVCHARSEAAPRMPAGAAPAVGMVGPPTVADLRDAVGERVVARTGRAADRFSVTIEDGDPHAAIVKSAESWHADLVIVGHRGATGLSRIWLGGVAEKVSRLAHCPVLVVRPKSGTRRVVVGTDFSDPALPAVKAAFDEAERVGGSVTLTHCLEWPLLPSDGAGFTSATVSAALLDDIQKEAAIKLQAASEGCPVPIEQHLNYGRASIELVRLAEAIDAHLLVVGTRGRTGISRVLLGNVAETVVRSASCPVLVVRLHGQAGPAL